MPTVFRLAVKSAEDFHHHDPRWGNTTAAERIVLAHWHMETNGFNVELPKMVTNKATVYARVDLGRWIVDCPWCKSAQHASREDHRFFCVECGNAAVNGAWVPVHWPHEWAEIEAILSVRPDKSNQWWSPGETLASLQSENDNHGVI
jgi:ribosomal protein L37AE/L43A